jgi:putative MATE family efflux protein
MTTGSPVRLIFLFALPLMAGNVFQQLYTVVDTAVVGKGLGVDALAAVGAADWFAWMVLGSIQGFAQGFAIRMAQRFGAGDIAGLRKVIANSVFLSIVCAVVITVCSQLAARPILVLLGTPDRILDMSLLYMRVLLSGMPIVMAYNLLAAILRSMGDSKTPLYAMVLASLLNIGLDLLFVLALHWGIAGAAAATLLAQAFSSLYCLHFLLRMKNLGLSRRDFHNENGWFSSDWAMRGELLRLGAPMALQNIIIAIGGMILQSVVNGFGLTFIAGYTATNKLYGMLEIAAISYGYAVSTYVGQNIGAGEYPRIRRGVRGAVLMAIGTSLLLGLVMILTGKLILSGFISGTAQEIAEAMDTAYRYLFIMSVFLPVLYILHIVRSSLQGMGDTVMPMASGFAEFIMRTGTALTLPRVIGGDGVFLAEVMAWVGADVILLVSYLVRVRKFPEK